MKVDFKQTEDPMSRGPIDPKIPTHTAGPHGPKTRFVWEHREHKEHGITGNR